MAPPEPETEEADAPVDMPGTAGLSLGRREAAKEARRQQIIHAARELIRETGSTGLSMRELAKRAGVSLATPYNLFGSKAAVVLAVMQDVREYRARFFKAASVDPIERIFNAVDLAVDYYLDDPAFYKTLWREVFSASSDVRSAIYNPKRDDFWRDLIQGAAHSGALDPGLDPELLRRQLDHQFRSLMLDWVTGELKPEALGPAIWLGYTLILLGAASPDWRGPLRARLLESQSRLKECGVHAGSLSVLPA